MNIATARNVAQSINNELKNSHNVVYAEAVKLATFGLFSMLDDCYTLGQARTVIATYKKLVNYFVGNEDFLYVSEAEYAYGTQCMLHINGQYDYSFNIIINVDGTLSIRV